jgi:hypothetical protein
MWNELPLRTWVDSSGMGIILGSKDIPNQFMGFSELQEIGRSIGLM